MEWKKDGSGSIWRMNKEKLIFVFCSGLLLFVLSMPGTEKERSLEAAAVGSGGMENTDRAEPAVFWTGQRTGRRKGNSRAFPDGRRPSPEAAADLCMKRSWSSGSPASWTG